MALSGHSRIHRRQMTRPTSGHFVHYSDIPFLKKPATVLQGVSLLCQTDPVNGYTMELRLAYYDYSPTDIKDQNPNNGP
ncbi:hypothetical protein TNIN_354651 [Trichonephila inaurata madagascariensis]|uniref:Uncharacterized protein n=1 Tax=Trichonephila inaurata madagascariensis TaxID=2747483 RepID=A0A8X6YFX9_9ARAC|nr:hypothetical protein TNIN_354651 [Trichonephila inaurata madagascariensis]